MSLMLTPYTICSWDELEFTDTIIPSTLHQVMKDIGEDEKVRTLIVKRYPFKGVKNYFTNSLFIKILSKLMRIHTQKNPILATKQIRSQKKTSVYGK